MLTPTVLGWLLIAAGTLLLILWVGIVVSYRLETRRMRKKLTQEILERAIR
jgi:hypothetical protein